MKAEAYYYQLFSKGQQQAYHAIREGLLALEPHFAVPRLSGKELADLYFAIRMDHPEIFYTVKFNYRYYEKADSVDMTPEYIFPKAKILEHRQALSSRIRKLALPAKELGEREKLLYIHDFICQNIRYDKLKKPYSHEIIGALGQGVAVCEGIAKAVKSLCDELGIWCILALSEANPEKGIKYRHAWNVIRLGGQYYHFDATFDNTISTDASLRYDYVCLSDAQIFRDHEPPIWKLPVCGDGAHTWYQEKKLSFTRYEDVRNRAKQAAKKGKPLLFHWRGGYLTREVLQDLLAILYEEAEGREKRAKVSLNWPQAVLQVTFLPKEELAESGYQLEAVNEGEQEQ